jgi:excinuclease UvrABC helicase subunit UvrB
MVDVFEIIQGDRSATLGGASPRKCYVLFWYRKLFHACSAPHPQEVVRYFPGLLTRDGDWLLFVDESHVTVPQLSMMHSATYARKQKS